MRRSDRHCLRVFVDVPRWYCRPNNTDMRYLKQNLPRLQEWGVQVDVWQPRSFGMVLSANWTFASRKLRTSLGGRPVDYARGWVDPREVARSRSDVIFSHGGFPMNARIPVLWQNTILDPDMQQARFGIDARVEQQKLIKRPLFARSAATVVATQLEADRLADWFPESADKFAAVPFFLPGLFVVDDLVLEKHRNSEKLRLLFVGNEARRKGLDIVLDAYTNLASHLRRGVRLTIVSSFDDGQIDIPSDDSIRVHSNLKHGEVADLMRDSHVLLHPARYESYGLVLIEAMAAGAVAIGPPWENQREILGNGTAGVNCAVSSDAVLSALEKLLTDEAYRLRLARAGLDRVRSNYSPDVVAQSYFSTISKVAST